MAKAREIGGLEPGLALRLAAARAVEVRGSELLAHGEGVLDTEDIEAVHDMRVASRRLRAALEIFATCFPADAHRAALREVKALADALGQRRDPDVAIAALGKLAGSITEPDRPGIEYLIERFVADQRRGNDALGAALLHMREDDLAGRLQRLVAFARTAAQGDAASAPSGGARPSERSLA